MLDLGQFLPQWVSVLVDATLKSLVILAVAGLTTAAMRRASAAARHAVWGMALASILALPMLATVLPNWDVGVIPAELIRGELAPAHTKTPSIPTLADITVAPIADIRVAPIADIRVAPIADIRVAPIADIKGAPKADIKVAPIADVKFAPNADDVGPVSKPDPTPAIAPLPTPRAISNPSVPDMPVSMSAFVAAAVTPIGVVWAIGAIFVLGLLVSGIVRTSIIARRSTPVLETEWLRLNDRLGRRLGIRRPVVLLRNKAATTPATWGVFNPIILLPAVSDEWSPSQRRDVLVHELAHIKRFDFLTQIISRYACAVYWFNPLMWLAARQMRIERERACDDEVLLAGAKASSYAGHLLEIARTVTGFSSTNFSTVSMAHRSQLSGRLLAILDDGRRRGSMSRLGATLAWLVAFVLLLPMASISIVRAQPADVVGVSETALVVPTADVAAVPLVPRVAIAQQDHPRQWASAPQCREVDGDNESRGINENSNDERQTSRWWDGDCEGEVRLRGEVRFTNDYTDIRSIPNGGRFSIEIDVDGDSRRVEIRPDGNGLQRRWFVNGAEATYGTDAERWLPLALQDFLRHSSYDLDGRVDFLLANGGVTALLDHAELSHGQYLARRFYVAAIETGELRPEQINEIIQRATRDVRSDFELATLLRAIPAADLRNTTLRQSYIQAANTIESDFEKARVLTTLLKQDGLETDVIRMLLASARDIESDFELARLLRALGTRYLDDPVARQSYLEAASSIDSDFELQRVLASLLETDNLSPENLRLLLQSAGQIESDFESARLLMGVADKFVVDESLRALFFQSVNSIDSDFERQRVLTTLVERNGLSNDVVSDAIRSAMTISGDFAKATVLRAIATKYRGDATLRSLLETAAETISSEYEYGRVMGAIRGRRS